MTKRSEFVVRLREASLTRSEYGSICGPIWCEIGAAALPAQGWNDFPVVVASWWLEKVADMVEGKKRKAYVNFMDGPFVVHVVAKHPDSWQGEFIERTLNGARLLQRFDFDPNHLIDSLITCADLLLGECSAHGWESNDIDSVRRHRERLLQYASQGHPNV